MGQPTDRMAIMHLMVTDAEAAFEAGDLDRAEVLSRALLATPGLEPVGCHFLGAISLRRKYPKDAVDWMERAMRAGYAPPTLLNNCGEAYRQLGDLDKAFQCFEKALKIDNKNPIPHFNLGLLMRARGHAREAEHFFQTAIAVSPEMSRAFFELGELYREEGHLKESERAYKEAIRSKEEKEAGSPDNESAIWRIRLASLLRERGNPLDAIKVLEAVPSLENSAQAQLELAICSFEMSWEIAAENHYRLAVELAPGLSSNLSHRLVMPRVESIRRWCESGHGQYTSLGRRQPLSLPELKVIPADAAAQFISPETSASPELFCATISPAEIIPYDFGVLSEGRFFCEGVINWDWHYGRRGHFSVHESDDMRLLMDIPAKTQQLDGACILVGGGGDHYQWLFDSLSRLWIVGQLPAIQGLPLILPASTVEGRLAMLDHLGIRREQLLLLGDDEILQAETLHVPSVMAMGNWVSPVALQFLRRHFGNGSGNRRRRLFLSRAHMPDRRLSNEPEIMKVLEKHGFELVEPDKLQPLDMMAEFTQAETIIGIDDDALANIVVAPQGAKLGIITTGGTHRARAHFICGQLAIEATYMIGEIDFNSHSVHALCDVVLPVSVLEAFLDELSG